MAIRPPAYRVSRRTRLLIPVVLLLVLLMSGFGALVSLYTDVLWYREVHFTRVFTTVLSTRVIMFVLFGAAMAFIVGANLTVAHVLRPQFRPMSLEQQNLERYRLAVEPRLRLIIVGISALFGIFTGMSAQGNWQTWLLWRNGVPFGRKDPQFHRDLSYYAFTYPFLRYVLGLLFTAVVLSILVSVVMHYLFGAIRLQTQTPGERMTAPARAHLSVLLGFFVLLKAWAYYLDRFGLVYSTRSTAKVAGPSYTDVNAVLPAKTILLLIALICALAFFANTAVRNFSLPIIAFGLLVLSAVLIGGAYPAAIQTFQARPNANTKEAPFIKRNISATLAAYGLDGAKTKPYDAKKSLTSAQVQADTGTVPNARLLDPSIITDTFTQQQQVKPVYGFADKLDIDRYTFEGKTQDYIVGIRELNNADLQGAQGNWINRHLVYTHGNGFVAAPANQVVKGGPNFVSGALTEALKKTTGENKRAVIPVDQPRAYYGELLPDYSIVGKKGGADREFDRPGEGGGQDQVNNTYAGAGGVPMGSELRRIAYALKFREPNILLNSAVTDKSRIIYIRDPRKRVERVAPFLTVDGDPYPAVVGGRIKWIVDGYTTSDGYANSERTTLGEATTDTFTNRGTAGQPQAQVNYIRNSVKATVDAYDGTVTLYAFDESDPVLRTWMRAFPHVVKPASAISDELRAHFRYPEDLFKVQREILARYHVHDPQTFFSGVASWSVPGDPTTPKDQPKKPQPPYYLLAQPPGATSTSFELTTVLNPIRKENLAALVTVSSDPDNYGRFTILEVPSNTVIPGPNQVQRNFTSTAEVSRDITLFDNGGSRVRFGNLLTLPVGGGLLYIEPLYVQAVGEGSQPLLRKVLVAFGDQVAYQDTLPQALDQLFGPGAGSTVAQPVGGPSPTPSGSPSPGPSGGPVGGSAGEVAAAVNDINAALDDLATAQKAGDFAGIGTAEGELQRAIQRFQKAQKAQPKPSVSVSPSPR
ncbi:MAG: UPF0182 family protein [Actinomycetota bacterium]|nr:UPF0182 family protein [Actinomycetota bacterium]